MCVCVCVCQVSMLHFYKFAVLSICRRKSRKGNYSQPSVEWGSLQLAFDIVGGFPRSGLHPIIIPRLQSAQTLALQRAAAGPKADCTLDFKIRTLALRP
jgi:hypothetical protein